MGDSQESKGIFGERNSEANESQKASPNIPDLHGHKNLLQKSQTDLLR